VLDADGNYLHDRVRVDTPHPCTPEMIVDELVALVKPLPDYDRISVGFPGMIRGGRILSAANMAHAQLSDPEPDPELVKAWHNFDLAGALDAALHKPVRVANDADMQGAAVIKGDGLELVITLGTGFGTAIFINGHIAPHLEIAHSQFRKGETYDEQLGDVTRQKIGKQRWSNRVLKALAALDTLMFYDHVFIGGGNSERVTIDLGPKAKIVDNSAGILGGIRLWDHNIV